MGSVVSLPVALERAGTSRSSAESVSARSRFPRFGLIALCTFLCGSVIRVRLDIGGEIFLLEPLVVLLAAQCALARGMGRGFVPEVFFGFLAAGLVTFGGYLISDIAAANEAWQYLKGWGRVGMLLADTVALMVLAAHDRECIWWLALGAGVGGVVSLFMDGVPIAHWKLGYGEYVAILMFTCLSWLPRWAVVFSIATFSTFCIVTDYRSLGAICLVILGIYLWRAGSWRRRAASGARLVLAVSAVMPALVGLIVFTQDQYAVRREESNVGRYVGLVVAWKAIKESPIIGYGSWAADEKFARMLRDEAVRTTGQGGNKLDLGRSLLPHSQLLQSWIEGGIAGLAFFLLYGWRLAGALGWFARRPFTSALTPIALFILISGAWNLLASPFLGIHRIFIAMAVAVIAISSHERRQREWCGASYVNPALTIKG